MTQAGNLGDGGLRGRCVVVTRDEGADGPLTAELGTRGARVLHWPTVRVSSPECRAELDTTLRNLLTYDWIAFTSARAVAAVLERPGTSRPPASLRVAAVGAGTSRALRELGWPVHVEPEDHSSVALVRALEEQGVAGRRVLFPSSSLAGRGLVQGLGEAGAEVHEVVAYRTVRLPLGAEAVAWCDALLGRENADSVDSEALLAREDAGSVDSEALLAREDADSVDAISFASPSAVGAWSDLLGPVRFGDLGRRVLIAAIGATTAAELRSSGCVDLVVAGESTFGGLVDVIEGTLAARTGRGREADG